MMETWLWNKIENLNYEFMNAETYISNGQSENRIE